MSTVMVMQNFIKIYQKVQETGPVSLFSEFEPRQNLDKSQMSFDNLIGYILPISMCMLNIITIFFIVQEIGPFSLFQNLELGKASTNKEMSVRNLLCSILSISLFTQKFIRIFHSVQEIGPFFILQNLALGKASFAIPWAKSFQHQIVCKNFIKYSKRFKS